MTFTFTLSDLIGTFFVITSLGTLFYIIYEMGVMKGRDLGRESHMDAVSQYLPWTDEFKRRNGE